MGCYVVRKGRKRIDGTLGHWYIVHESNFRIEKGKQKKDAPTVSKAEWKRLGFLEDWTLEEARKYCDALNAGGPQ